MPKGKPSSPSSGKNPGGATGSSTATCPLECPTSVKFEEHGTNYGWDDHTNAAIPWKSVEKGRSDTVKAVIKPADKACNLSFESSATGKVTVSPAKAASGTQIVTVTGVANGEAEIRATCKGSMLGRFKAKTYTKKKKTAAVRLVHDKHYTSTDLADATIKAFLKKVYKQAVFEFELTRLPAKTVEFDTVTTTKDAAGKVTRTAGRDGKVDVEAWMTKEMKKIRDTCKDDSYDYNIFLVDNPSDGSFGFMDYNQKYGYVHADQTTSPEKSFAHELGHGAWGLAHKNSDAVNNMSQGDSASKWRLRKDQWDKIN